MAGGCSGGGERGSIGLSGDVRLRPACVAAGGEGGSASQSIIRLAGGVSSAPLCP